MEENPNPIDPPSNNPAQPEESVDNKSIVFTSKVFQDPDDFEAYRMAQIDCDLELRFYTQPPVYAHKVILRRRSTFFSRKFAHDPDCTFIELTSPLDSRLIELLVKYIYTGKLEIAISLKNLMHLIVAAKELEVDEINIDCCSDILKQKLSSKSCWLLKEVAKELSLETLELHIENWMKRNFNSIVSEAEFLDVQFDDILQLVQSTSRTYTSEVTIFEGILKWVEHKEEQRKARLFDLIRILKFEDLFNTNLELLKEKYKEGSLLDSDPNCSRIFNQICRNKAFEYDAIIKQQAFEPPTVTPSASPVLPMSSASSIRLPKSITINIIPVETILTPQFKSVRKTRSTSASNASVAPNRTLNYVDQESNESSDSDVELITKKKRRVSSKRSIVSFQDHLNNFASTSANEMKILNLRKQGSTTYVQAYNFHTNITKNLYQLRRPREFSSIIMVEDSVYHIGGERKDNKEAATDVDIYNPRFKKGYHGPTLQTPAKNAAACLFNNSIYVIGGEESIEEHSCTHNTTQFLDLSLTGPAKKKWEVMEYMHHIRDSLGVAVLGNKIYAAGGNGTCFKKHEETYPMNTVECYSPDTNSWELLKQSYLKVPRAHLKLCTMENKLYAVGGFNFELVPLQSTSHKKMEIDRNRLTLSSVEVFDPNRGKDWTFIANMNDERHAGAVFTRNGLLYAIGGNSGPVPTAEFYDPRIDIWQYLSWPSELQKPKEGEVSYEYAIAFP